jgi:prepilin-type N-terminal cleavage/methylation domain-containing protein
MALPHFFSRLSRRTSDRRGMTLIEIMVVVVLIVLIATLALPNLSSVLNMSLKSTARRVGGLVKEAYSQSLITGRVHRIVYDFEKNEYWVEKGSTEVLLDTEQSKKMEKDIEARLFRKKEPDTSGWNRDGRLSKKKYSLDRGVKFVEIVTDQSAEPIREGMAYTHLLPTGEAEKTAVFLEDLDNHKNHLGHRTFKRPGHGSSGPLKDRRHFRKGEKKP